MNKKADWRNIAGGALNVGMGVGTALATDALLGYIPALKKRRGVRFLMSLGVGLPVTVFGNQIRSGMGDFWDSVTGKADLLKALNAQAANKAADREETAAALLRGDASPLPPGRGQDELPPLPYTPGPTQEDPRPSVQKMIEAAETERLRRGFEQFSKEYDKAQEPYYPPSRQDHWDAVNAAGY